MSRKLARLVLATAVAAGLWLAVSGGAGAAEHGIEVTGDAAKCDKTWGPPCFAPGNGTITPVEVGDKVTWHVTDGTHTVTPVDSKAFKGSDDLKGPDGTFSVTFDKVGVYAYYCTHHGQVDADGKTFHGMWGKIDVRNPNAASTTTASPTTATTAPPAGPPSAGPPPSEPPPVPGPPAGGSAPTEPRPPPPPAPAPPAAAPAPVAEGGRKKNEATTTAQGASVPLPPLPDLSSPSPAPPTSPTTGSTLSAPPQGNAVAILEHPRARRRRAVVIVTGVGVAVLGLGGAGWKFAHRSSKYWPA